jgi:hypothetical protein
MPQSLAQIYVHLVEFDTDRCGIERSVQSLGCIAGWGTPALQAGIGRVMAGIRRDVRCGPRVAPWALIPRPFRPDLGTPSTVWGGPAGAVGQPERKTTNGHPRRGHAARRPLIPQIYVEQQKNLGCRPRLRVVFRSAKAFSLAVREATLLLKRRI